MKLKISFEFAELPLKVKTYIDFEKLEIAYGLKSKSCCESAVIATQWP